MNDPAVKIALALSILLGGFLAAVAFRPNPTVPQPDSAAPSWSELAALRNRRLSENAVSTPKGKTAVSAPSCQPTTNAPTRVPTVLTPLDNPPAVPSLSAKYPGDGPASSTGWGMPVVPPPKSPLAEKKPLLHKIVDGDTLPALAEQYLGSPNRAIEIFNANREALSDPELLPIGVELNIPQ